MSDKLDLPTGTVTFMFTDIEGSTRHLAAMGEDFAPMLARHHDLMRSSIAANNGLVVGTEGDAFFAVFRDAPGALRAGVDAQRGLSAEPWPGGADIRVRMGMLSGNGVLGGDNYIGLDVHRAARIAAAANGGQLVISDSMRALVENDLPNGVDLRDLGEHKLKDLPRRERIFQVEIEELPVDFPPLRSLDARPNNLPVLISSFVGRDRETAQLVEALESARLLTLTGPGGTGKTRLAIRVASELLEQFEHGCWFVPLETFEEPDLVPPAIAEALNVTLPGDRPAIDVLAEWLADRQLLLVLDNFEQVAAAAPLVARMLAAAPRLTVLATSRTPLHVYGESEYPVPPLSTLSELRAAAASVEALTQYAAVQLFIERAVSARPSFAVTNDNAPALAEICIRLDGLPLAIELAAARIKLLSLEQILVRLADSLTLLASSASDLPARQRTLNGAIDWSFRLLTEAEQRLLARLSVFSGGMSLDAAAEIAADGLEVDAFDALASLADKSLLRSEELAADTRFVMLETIRQYAAAQLAADPPERRAILQRHATFFFALGVTAEHEIVGKDQSAWLDRLERDDDNLRTAFGAAPTIGMLDDALIAASSIWRFWQQRGRFAEGRAIFERLLEEPNSSPASRARALMGAGGIAYWQAEYQTMAAWYVEARELAERSGDHLLLADALFNESFVPMSAGDLASAAAIAERAHDLYAEQGDDLGAARSDGTIAMANFWQGDYVAAMHHVERAVAVFRARGDKLELADHLTNLAVGLALDGDWKEAIAALDESAAIFDEAGNELGVAIVMEGYASMSAWAGESERAARLFGFVDATKDRVGGSPPAFLIQSDQFRALAIEQLGEGEFARLAAEGARLSVARAMEIARMPLPDDTPPWPRLSTAS